MVANAAEWLKNLIQHAESCQAERTAEAEEQEVERPKEGELTGQNEFDKEIPGAAGEPSAQNMFCIPCHRAVNRICRTCSMLSLKTLVLQCYCAIDTCSLYAGELPDHEEEHASAKETHAGSDTPNEGDQQLIMM
jgi:hypothetical protein